MHKFNVFLLILVLSLGQLVSVVKTGETSIYLFDLFILIFSFGYFIYFISVRRSFKLPKLLLLICVFTLIAGLSLLYRFSAYPLDKFVVALFYFVRLVGYLTASIVIFNLLEAKLLTLEILYKFIVASGLFIVAIGLIQLVVLPDFETLDPALGWDPHKNRLASTFFDPNFTGAYLVICITIIFEKLFSKKGLSLHNLKVSSKLNLLGLFSILLILFYAVFLTFSRSAWAMLAVIIFIYGIYRSRLLLFLSLFLAFGAYYAVPRIQTRIAGVTDPADSARFRYVSWVNTSEIIKDNWFAGVGFNTMRYVQKDYGFLNWDTLYEHSGAGSDSSLMFIFATTGILGILIFTVGFLYVFVRSLDKNQQNILLVALITSLMVESLFINSLFYPQIMFLWMTLLAVNSPSRT